MAVADSLGVAIAVLGAYWITAGSFQAESISIQLMTLAAVAIVVPIAWYHGLYQSIIRYIGIDLLTSGFRTVVYSSVIIGCLGYYVEYIHAPFRWVIAFFSFSLLYIVGGRFAARVFLNVRIGNREPVIIYGAGSGGARLTAALKSSGEFDPVAMVDDNVLLTGKRLDGVEVFAPNNIERLVEQTGATRILLAIPGASRHRRRAVLERLSEFPVHVQTVPEISDLVSGKSRVDDIRDIDVADLLGRDAVPPDNKLLRASIDGKTVMVTGAGGSIGSELCRQIIHLGPKCLVLFEISEIAL
jgi:FlaA1/EpsC-like NDP-sugar epimerase